MSNVSNGAVKDMIFSIVTTQGLGSGHFTSHITCFEEQYLFLIERIAMMRKLSIQFECGVLGY